MLLETSLQFWEHLIANYKTGTKQAQRVMPPAPGSAELNYKQGQSGAHDYKKEITKSSAEAESSLPKCRCVPRDVQTRKGTLGLSQRAAWSELV